MTAVIFKFVRGEVGSAGSPLHRENGQKFPVRKIRKLENFAKIQGFTKFCQNTGKTQRILLAQVVNSLIQKVMDIAIFAAKKSYFS